MEKQEKPDCYECVHRGKVAGSAHSSCHHPAFVKAHDNPLMNIMAIFGSVGRAPPMQVKSDEVEVVGNSHGIAHGWFNHPFNFDPVWLEKCTGYESRSQPSPPCKGRDGSGA